MKIAINSKESGEYWIAFNTEPKLTPPIFERYQRLHAIDATLNHFKPDYRAETSLLILISSGNPIDSGIHATLIETVERVLSSAEALVNPEVAPRQDDSKKAKGKKKLKRRPKS